MQERHEAREEGDRPDRSEDPLEQLGRADHFAAQRAHRSDLEGVEKPGPGNERRKEAGEKQQNGKSQQAEAQILDISGTEEVENLRQYEQVDRERPDREDERVAQTRGPWLRDADVETAPAGDRAVG